MAISDNYSPDISLGNGVTTQFSGSWKVLNADYFKAALQSVATGIQTPLVQGSDYTLEFDDDGYEITLAVAPTSANYIVRYREVALDQTDPYRTSKGFQGKVVEDSFDKLTAIDQDQQDQIDRSLKFQVGSPAAGYTIEDPIDGRALKWDIPSNKIVNSTFDPDQAQSDASSARDEAVAARDAAIAAQGSAEDAETNAEDQADNSAASALLSQAWATQTGSPVSGGQYGAKYYSDLAATFPPSSVGQTAQAAYMADGAGGSGWRRLVLDDLADLNGGYGAIPIGVPFPVWDNLAGVSAPSNAGTKKFVKLTAGLTGPGQYNEGLLTSESVTGSAPLVVATAVINAGAMTGATIHLINSELSFIRAGTSPSALTQDAMQNLTGYFAVSTGSGTWGLSSGAMAASGVFGSETSPYAQMVATGNSQSDIRRPNIDASRQARTATENRPKNVQATYYMRIN